MHPPTGLCGVAIRFLLLIAVGASACSSNSSPPTSPPGVMASYEGQWSGMTSQGMRITFSVADQKVTSLDIGYNFNGCSGTNTYPNLSLPIGYPPNPASPSMGAGFGYGSGAPDRPNYTQVYGTFSSGTAATGTMIFGEYSGCGNSLGIWSATKR